MSVLPADDVISLARGVPSPDMLPLGRLAECARLGVERHGRVALNYGAPGGFEPLRAWVAERHGVAPERVLLTPGSMIALTLAVGELVGRDGAVAAEIPTYDRFLATAAHAGAAVVGVRRDADGLDLDGLRASVRGGGHRPSLLYVLPSFHNPTGRTLSVAQREALADTALELDLPVLEDDAYGLLRVEGDMPPTVAELLRAQGGDHLALFASSFSKSVAPGLRVGYLVLPERFAPRLAAAALRTYVSPPLLPQAQLYEFLAGGHLEPHLVAARGFLRAGRDALIGVLAEELPEGVGFTHPEGGYFLWLDLPAGCDAAALAAKARAAGVDIFPGQGFHADGSGANTARLAFSFPPAEQVREGARRLARIVRQELA